MVLTLPEITTVSPSLYELEFVFTVIRDSAKTGSVTIIPKIKNIKIISVFTKIIVMQLYISFTIKK
ncbi:hypothetical protein YTPLAS73_07290 [Nitrosarchaeum sp.]|nr:hypothetical protein YTPLAS73_07290 [Nitrosarchaeum sp.]